MRSPLIQLQSSEGRKREGVTDGPELLDAPLLDGHLALKLLLGFLSVGQLLSQDLLLLSHGGDLISRTE